MKGGETAMKSYSEIQLLLANEEIRSRAIEAANARLARRPRIQPSFRRQIGYRIIEIGERLAEESRFEPARSR